MAAYWYDPVQYLIHRASTGRGTDRNEAGKRGNAGGNQKAYKNQQKL